MSLQTMRHDEHHESAAERWTIHAFILVIAAVSLAMALL